MVWCFCAFIPLDGSSCKPTVFPWNNNFRHVKCVCCSAPTAVFMNNTDKTSDLGRKHAVRHCSAEPAELHFTCAVLFTVHSHLCSGTEPRTSHPWILLLYWPPRTGEYLDRWSTHNMDPMSSCNSIVLMLLGGGSLFSQLFLDDTKVKNFVTCFKGKLKSRMKPIE